jgi:DNA-binding transcriptional MerR regulator
MQWFPDGTQPLSRFQQWYDQNAQALNARRKHRYHTDPAYREQLLASQRARRKVKRQHRQYKETVLGQMVRAYEIREVSALIGKPCSTIRQWESTGLIPCSIFKTKKRLYTVQQIHLLREIVALMDGAGVTHTDHAKIRDRLAAHKITIHQHWHDLEQEPVREAREKESRYQSGKTTPDLAPALLE